MADPALLAKMAKKYVWWKDPAETLANPIHFLGQAMNLATWNDVMVLFDHFGRQAFIDALAGSEAGTLNERSWNFWHLWLGLTVPELPQRKTG